MSLANVQNDKIKIQKNNIVKDGLPNPTKSTILPKSYELDKSEDSDQNTATYKAQYSRMDIHLRKDVVNKTIIRAFKNFYIKHFKSKLDFNNKTRDFWYGALCQKVNRKIASLTSFHKHFGKIDNDEFEGKSQPNDY